MKIFELLDLIEREKIDVNYELRTFDYVLNFPEKVQMVKVDDELKEVVVY